MLYLSRFCFPGWEKEESFRWSISRTCYDSFYPFGVLSKVDFRQIDFEPVTILYGGNGSGKTTALNVIAEKLHLVRDTLYNRSNFWDDYLRYCKYEADQPIPRGSRIITSDDVFDYMLSLRCLNEGIDNKREELFEEYQEEKRSGFKMRSLDDYERLKRVNQARKSSQSKYVRKYLTDNVREYSNGESAFLYFSDKLHENALFLLDESENSLSPEKQMELVRLIEDCVRFFGCQVIIASHSPFILSMRYAKIYDLDEQPVDVKKWTELRNVRTYYDFFKEHELEFR